jgi:hypothetical protein
MQSHHDATRLAINAEIGETPNEIYNALKIARHNNHSMLCEIFGGDARAKSDLALAIAACDAAMAELYPQCQFSIGEVNLFEPYDHPERGPSKRDARLIGPPRIAALKCAYRGEPLPNNLSLFVYGFGEITPAQVAWETSGIPDRA